MSRSRRREAPASGERALEQREKTRRVLLCNAQPHWKRAGPLAQARTLSASSLEAREVLLRRNEDRVVRGSFRQEAGGIVVAERVMIGECDALNDPGALG